MNQVLLASYGQEDGNFYVEHMKRSSWFEKENHLHECYEIYFLIEGRRLYFSEDQAYEINPGDMVIVNKNVVHKTAGLDTGAHERILIQFSDRVVPRALLNAFHSEILVLRMDPSEKHVIEDLLHRIIDGVQQSKPANEMYSMHDLVLLLIYLTLSIGRNETLPNAVGNDCPIVAEVIRYINERYDQSLTLKHISNAFSYSHFYLCRMFKRITGVNFIEYINLVRVWEAKKLLRYTEEKIIDIALKTGFENVTHFGRLFKKVTGATPSQYRKYSSITHIN